MRVKRKHHGYPDGYTTWKIKLSEHEARLLGEFLWDSLATAGTSPEAFNLAKSVYEELPVLRGEEDQGG